MEQTTYQQILAEVYEDNAKNVLIHQTEYEDEDISPEDNQSDELENQEDFQKYSGSHAVASSLPNPPSHEDKTKLGVLYDKQTQTRIINIDSRFRDNFSITPSNDFIFKLADPIKNVISVRLSSIELPNTFYAFSAKRGNTTFWLTYPSASYSTPGPRVLITIPDGNWDTSTYDSTAPTTSATSILNLVASKMTQVANDILNLPSGVIPATFKLTLSASNGKLQIINGTGSFPSIPFDIDFSPIDPTLNARVSDFGLGYNLGFRQREYLYNTSIQGTSIVNVIDTNYIFVSLDPDWKIIYQETPDRTQLNTFAKIIVNVPKFSVVFDNGSNTLTKEYFLKQPTNIVSIPIRLSDPYDQDLDLNGMDFSLSLEVKEVLDYSLYEFMRH